MVSFAALPGVVLMPAGTANADVCASAGRRITVGGCANIADAVAPYAPAPSAYAPLPEDQPPPPPPAPNVRGCVGYNGRFVSANGCN
nr:hypothetical protein [Mycolicibacterium insubricum]